jgi:N6-L-threonylcarbamoyladenine synthase
MSKGVYDFSFSGLKTAAVNAIHNASQKNESICIPDFGASFINSVVGFLSGNTESAARDLGYKRNRACGRVNPQTAFCA